MEERRVQKNVKQELKIRKAVKSYSEQEWNKVAEEWEKTAEERFFKNVDVDPDMFCKFH